MTVSPFDPGLQLERSELAWRRSSLTFGLVSIVALRLLPAVFDDARWVVVGVVGVLFSAAVWTLARRRSRMISAALRTDGLRAALPGGALIFAVALGLSIAGAAAAAVVITAA